MNDDLQKKYEKALIRRNKFKNKIISVTGTCGKTTLCNLLKKALLLNYTVEKTWNNSNSLKGIPWCINNDLSLNTEFWIIEIGIAEKGTMKLLLDLVQPNIRIITNIGIAHTLNFNNETEYQKEKMVFIENLPENSTIIIDNDNELLKNFNYQKNITVIRCGSDLKSDVILKHYKFNSCNLTSNISIQTKKGTISFTTKIIGRHFAKLICLVTACCLHLNIELEKLIKIFEKYEHCCNRGNIIKKNEMIIFNYSYNCNPSSIEQNLILFNDINSENKIIVLGDMLELNKEKEYFYHKDIYRKCLNITTNICVYTKIFKNLVINEKLDHLFMEDDLKKIGLLIKNYVNKNKKKYFIFIQGSNTTNIDEILKTL